MIQRYRTSGQWRDGTIVERFGMLVQEDSQVPILIDRDGTATRSFIWEQACRVATALRQLGVEKGDVVSFQLPNWFEAAVIDLASAMCGAVVNPIVPIYRERELAHILNDCRARVIFVPEVFRGIEHAAMIEAMRPDLPWLEHFVTVRPRNLAAPGIGWDALLEGSRVEGFAPEPADANSVKIVMYTSGTTGAAKSVLHSHSTIDAEVRTVAHHYGLRPQDRVFMPSPVTHITGYLYGIQMPMTFGMPAVFMDHWDKDVAIELIEEQACTFTVGATPFLQELRDAVAARGRPLANLQHFLCGGAPVPSELVYDARRVMGECIPGRVYGSTEAPTISLGPADAAHMKIAAESDGEVVGYEVKLLGAAGQPVPFGEEGEIAVRGPELFLGYGDPVRDAEAFDDHGFFLTGDLGRLDSDGVVVITGRKKDLIIRGGENISAKEIEDVLHSHPAIAEAVIVAMPHARLGETCCAIVSLVPGSALSSAEVMSYVAASGLAKQKIPERVDFMEVLPKTASGKILKAQLRLQIAKQAATA
ncbi:AMP-binding protein [Sphingobium lactosutens]|uniref:AMP-binding protein n=1 Tax=Sphingobium lactosutens TaxID=522773 RepID=UPI001C4B4513|nr:AMP-binding protein [Sphingobium lactosutens]